MVQTTYLIDKNVASFVTGINEADTIGIKYEGRFKGMPTKGFLDGKKLTNLMVAASMNNQKDVDDLIDFLKIAKFCFIEK